MILAFAAFASAALAAAPGSAARVERRTVVRLRARHLPVAPPPPQVYREKRGPHCVYSQDVQGAAVSGRAQIDLALRGGDHVRAILGDECPALDFYRGFYLAPSADGKVCADRDVIRTRAGGECAIDRFRSLVPVPVAPPPAAPRPR